MTRLYDGTDNRLPADTALGGRKILPSAPWPPPPSLPAPIDRHEATDLEMRRGEDAEVPRPLSPMRYRPPLTGYRVILGVVIIALIAGFICYRLGHIDGRHEQQEAAQVTIAAYADAAAQAADSADDWRLRAIDASATAEALESDLASVTAEWRRQAEEASSTIGILEQKKAVKRAAPKTLQVSAPRASYASGVEQWRGLVAEWVAYYGGGSDNVEQFLRVMTGESHGDPGATNGQHQGLMQIASIVHADAIAQKSTEWGMAPDLYDPVFNIRFAAYMSAGGRNWSGWSVKP